MSGAVADVLGQVSTWRQALHDLGEAEVKHGVRVRIYNLYTDEVGNPGLPHKLEAARNAQAAAAATTAPLTPPSVPIAQTSTSTLAVPPPTQTPSQPSPSVMQASRPPTGRRGLYMALGALLVLVVLVAAGLYVPYRNKTRASEHANPVQPAPTGTASGATPAPTTEATNPTASSGANAGASQSSAPSESNPAASQPQTEPAPPSQTGKKPASGRRGQPSASATEQPAPPAATAGAPAQSDDAAQLEELEQTVDQLSSRASAVNDSLENLRRQQAAQGYGLRGDISSAQEMMRTNLSRAQVALQNRDVKNAQKYSDLAATQVEKLEQFLGR